VLTERRGFGQTMRPDAWWLQPVAVFLGLSAFIVYSTWAAFQGQHYAHGNYLSPFYSPELFGDTHHAWLGPKPAWWLSWLPWSPAFLILWAPGGFRLTCYYYRGAYYKAFWADPPSCAVGEPRKAYRGEHSFPLILQNVHRYFLYIALVFVLTVNVILLGGYTLGCHSLRHLVGGHLNLLSRHPARRKAHSCVTCLNRRHMLFAWLSLFWVGFSDFYVRMLSMGVFTDWRLF
jgi:hypothetical protein